MTINWLPIIGTAQVDKEANKIIYTPSEITLQDGSKAMEITILTSNVNFENGEIFFKVALSNKISICQIILNDRLGSDPLHIGLSSDEKRGFLFVAMKSDRQTKQWKIIDGKGDNRNLVLNTDYEIRINVKGSIINFFVDGILVMSLFETIIKAPLKLVMRGNGDIVVSNFKVMQQKPIAFIIMQFSDEYNQLFEEVIRPTCEGKGFECIRANDKYTTNPIIQDIIESIHESSVIIANITPDNPNIFYEVGFAHAIKKPTILLCDRIRQNLPFDLSGFRTLFYENTIAGKSSIERDLNRYLDNLFGS